MSYLLERDTLNGAAGKAVLIRDGQVQELFGAKNVKTQAEITSSDMKVVGTKRTQQKPGAVKQTGTTAPTPPSISTITWRNCMIELVSPLISDP